MQVAAAEDDDADLTPGERTARRDRATDAAREIRDREMDAARRRRGAVVEATVEVKPGKVYATAETMQALIEGLTGMGLNVRSEQARVS